MAFTFFQLKPYIKLMLSKYLDFNDKNELNH